VPSGQEGEHETCAFSMIQGLKENQLGIKNLNKKLIYFKYALVT